MSRGGPSCDAARGPDEDGDGLADVCEEALADRFAPIVIHSSAESTFPTDVDQFLPQTSLSFRDDGCPDGSRDVVLAVAPATQDLLLGHTERSHCGGVAVTSDGSRSGRKRRTFYLTDVPIAARPGSADSRHWKTYVHAYPNDLGGVTLQYWRFYAFNRAFADHGGDWEAVHVVLRRDETVATVRLLGHRSIDEDPPDALDWEGTHPVIYSDVGGHTSRTRGDGIAARGCVAEQPCAVNLGDLSSFVRQETWTGGRVVWFDGRVTASGGLVNVGEKSRPMNGQVFVRYSGLWGSPGRFYVTSGYWGPAFNETGLRSDGFITAWCAGMTLRPGRDIKQECWAEESEL